MLGLALATEEQGRDALATAEVLQDSSPRSGSSMLPTVTVKHQGHLLVLTYRAAGGGLSSNTRPRGEPPTFTIYKGSRQVASGQFEYG
jgi:hypothetical protein